MRLWFLFLCTLIGCRCNEGGAPPTVRILSPTDRATLDGNGPHAVTGEAEDPDEILDPENVTWRSDRDGVVGSGAITTIRLTAGEHRLTLEAIDRDGRSGSAQITIFVRVLSSGETDAGSIDAGTADGGTPADGGAMPDGGTNQPPVVTIQQPTHNATFDEGQPVELIGSAVDQEDGTLSGSALVWTSNRAGVLGSGGRVTFTNAALGVHQLVLTATDRSGKTGLASVSISIVRPGSNRPPTVAISSPSNGAQFTVGQMTSLQGSGTDPEDGPLSGTSLRWTSSAMGTLGTGPMLVASLSQGVHVLTLTATDSLGATGSASVTVSVNQANNRPPTANITAPVSMHSVFQGTAVTFVGAGSDPEDGMLSGMSLSWSSSRDGALGTGSPLMTSALSAGEHTISLIARDSGGNTGTASVLVRVLPMNQAPQVLISSPATGASVSAGSTLNFVGMATDAEDGPLSGSAVRWSSSRDGALGTGLAVSTAALTVGMHTISLTATDSGGRSASTSISVTVTPSMMNLPPLARLTGPGTGQAGDTLTFDGSTSSDSDGTIVSFRFDMGDGTAPVSSTSPTSRHGFANAGRYTVTLTVTDNRGATGSATLTVIISPLVRVPVVVTPARADVGSACSIATPGQRVLLAWTASIHPAIYFGEYQNGTLQAELVDGLGFNTGGTTTQHVALEVDRSGTPHLVYLRENEVVYATKVSGSWVKERVDSTTQPWASNSSSTFGPALALHDAAISVLYLTASPYRPVVASRTAANTWTRTTVPGSGTATGSSVYPLGELALEASGQHLFAVSDFTLSPAGTRLVSFGPTGVGTLTPTFPLSERVSLSLSGNRLFAYWNRGLAQLTLATPFSASSISHSFLEMSLSTTQHAVAADAAGLPRILTNHSGSLEHIWASSNPSFWERVELGPADPGLVDVSVNGANVTRACFIRAGKLMLY